VRAELDHANCRGGGLSSFLLGEQGK